MHDLPFEQIRDRRNSDMRMRANLDALSWRQLRGAHVIKKNEGPDQLASRRRQGTSNREFAQVLFRGLDDQFDRALVR